MYLGVLERAEGPLFHSRLGLWIAYRIVTHAGGSLGFADNELRGGDRHGPVAEKMEL